MRISIDTYKAGTARAAVEAGASVINDVSGGRLDPDILGVAGRDRAPGSCSGTCAGRRRTMMDDVSFRDVVDEVGAELGERLAAARAAGCHETWVDPGIGFGKRLEHNLALLRGAAGAARRASASR